MSLWKVISRKSFKRERVLQFFAHLFDVSQRKWEWILCFAVTDDRWSSGSAGWEGLQEISVPATLLKWVQLCVQSKFLMLSLWKTAEMEAAVLFPYFMILLVKKKHFFWGQICLVSSCAHCLSSIMRKKHPRMWFHVMPCSTPSFALQGVMRSEIRCRLWEPGSQQTAAQLPLGQAQVHHRVSLSLCWAAGAWGSPLDLSEQTILLGVPSSGPYPVISAISMAASSASWTWHWAAQTCRLSARVLKVCQCVKVQTDVFLVFQRCLGSVSCCNWWERRVSAYGGSKPHRKQQGRGGRAVLPQDLGLAFPPFIGQERSDPRKHRAGASSLPLLPFPGREQALRFPP